MYHAFINLFQLDTSFTLDVIKKSYKLTSELNQFEFLGNNTIQMSSPQFHTDPLISTHQFNTKGPLLFSPQNPSAQHKKKLRVCVELRVFW